MPRFQLIKTAYALLWSTLLFAPSMVAQSIYDIVILKPQTNHTASAVRTINVLGQVAGYSSGVNTSAQPGYWHTADANGDFQRPPNTPTNATEATAINSGGLITAQTLPLSSNAWYYSDYLKTWQPLKGIDPRGKTAVLMVNENHYMIGWCSLYDGTLNPKKYPVLWANPQIAQVLPLPNNSTSGHATDINNNQMAVGSATGTNGHEHAMLWDAYNLTPGVLLPDGSAETSAALAVNQNLAVGYRVSLTGEIQPIRWDILTRTNSILASLSGVTDLMAQGVNSNGTSVGSGYNLDPSHPRTVAIRWQATNSQSLETLLAAGNGWQLLEATSINNAGEIAGNGKLFGLTRGFKLLPHNPDNLRPNICLVKDAIQSGMRQLQWSIDDPDNGINTVIAVNPNNQVVKVWNTPPYALAATTNQVLQLFAFDNRGAQTTATYPPASPSLRVQTNSAGAVILGLSQTNNVTIQATLNGNTWYDLDIIPAPTHTLSGGIRFLAFRLADQPFTPPPPSILAERPVVPGQLELLLNTTSCAIMTSTNLTTWTTESKATNTSYTTKPRSGETARFWKAVP